MNGDETKLVGLIRRVLSSKGLDVRGSTKVSWRFLDEGYAVIPIKSLARLVHFWGEGRCYIECVNVNVKGIDEHLFSITYMLIDATYEHSKWSVRLFMDEEETYNESIDHLEKRRKKIEIAIKSSLELLTFIIELVKQGKLEPSG